MGTVTPWARVRGGATTSTCPGPPGMWATWSTLISLSLLYHLSLLGVVLFSGFSFKETHDPNRYILAFNRILMPIAVKFNPDLVLVSAGFDAALGDPLGGCRVRPRQCGASTVSAVLVFICLS